MKKVFFSFIAIFCFFIAFNSCQALTIQGDGVAVEISDEYVSYVCLKGDGSEGDGYGGVILASKVKGIFKKNWVSNQGSYMYYFYPEGSDSYTKYDKFSINSGSNMAGPTNGTCWKFSNNTVLQGNTTIMYGTVRGTDTHYEGEIVYQPTPDDPAIGDASSKLKLTYEYNEEFTECKINATLEDGVFTDKIYYSTSYSHLEGVLENKLEFPNSRYYNFRKCYCIFSSGR